MYAYMHTFDNALLEDTYNFRCLPRCALRTSHAQILNYCGSSVYWKVETRSCYELIHEHWFYTYIYSGNVLRNPLAPSARELACQPAKRSKQAARYEWGVVCWSSLFSYFWSLQQLTASKKRASNSIMNKTLRQVEIVSLVMECIQGF